MRDVLKSRGDRKAQTVVFFLLAFTMIFLLCGLAIDSGLLYLAKARLSRAVDGAALAAVGNFHSSDDPLTNRQDVASIMRNFAVANFQDLSTISTTATEVQSPYTTTAGISAYQYTYTFYDPSPGTGGQDPNGAYRRYVQVVLQTGSGGQITSGQCNARCPVQTYFMGYLDGTIGGFKGIAAFKDLKVSSTAISTRNPRLIMVVVDRSGSMLFPGGGAFGLPAAITTFLNFFDTTSDYIGIVSFSGSARLEMPLTTNFLNAGTNDLYDSYQIDNDGSAIPGVDPEEYTNYSNFTTNDVRRLKFGGQTAADEGLRLAMEQLMANSGFGNPNVVKYIVLFTDGAWNTSRTLLTAPGYTNVVSYPNPPSGNNVIVSGPEAAPYGANSLQLIPLPFGYIPMPTLSPWPQYSNAVTFVAPQTANGFDYQDHTSDIWQSTDGTNEPLGTAASMTGKTLDVANSTNYLLTVPAYTYPFASSSTPTVVYTSSVNVWVPPGAVDYVYTNGVSTPVTTVVSDYTNPTLTTNITLQPGQSNVLVVPGYMVDGIFSDSLDLAYPDDPSDGASSTTYPRYRADNYNEPFAWNDDTNNVSTVTAINSYQQALSVERNLMFRNYVNLLDGYYIFRPDDPLGDASDIDPNTGAVRPLYGNGAYYPEPGFYFPFDLMGIDQYPNFALQDAISDPDPTHQGLSRFIAFSINMLSSNAAPEYAGELFYQGTGGINANSGAASASTQITSSAGWKTNAPAWITPLVNGGMVIDDSSHNTNIDGALWRPIAFNGSNGIASSMANTNDSDLTTEVNLSDGANKTGGYVQDGQGHVFRNAMAYSGRPTHYYDFSSSVWRPIPDNHTKVVALPLGNWKAKEYAWHARAAGVTIYTVGYGTDVTPSEQDLLAEVANATNSTANTTETNFPFLPTQPIGEQFYASTPADISNDFYQVGTAINGALTQ